MHKNIWMAILAMIFYSSNANAEDKKQQVVLELFTSQSCSSCPAADSLLKKIASSDSDILALSFHVDYWDHLNWKDTYSSPIYTARQRGYAQALNARGVFTPQLIINGRLSVVGSDSGDVQDAISSAKKVPALVNITFSTDDKTQQLIATIAANNKSVSQSFDILEVQFDPYGKTIVKSGENGGRTLESINNVTRIQNLGEFKTDNVKTIGLQKPSNAGVAIIIQAKNNGAIVGAASHLVTP